MIGSGSFEQGRPSPFDYLKPEYRNERFETPIDDRGLIDEVALIGLVKSLVYPEYDWRDGRKPDIHHLYYHESEYKFPYTIANPKLTIFRELPFHKILVPRSFHEFTEAITIRAKPPKRDVVEARIMACKNAIPLFIAASGIVRTPRQYRRRKDQILKGIIKPKSGDEDEDGIQWLRSTLDDYFAGFEKYLKATEEIPSEFRFFEPSNVGESPEAVAKALGRTRVEEVIRRNNLNHVPVVLAS